MMEGLEGPAPKLALCGGEKPDDMSYERGP